MRRLTKDIHSANAYLHGAADKGCIGLPLAAYDSEIALVDTSFKLLMSEDPHFKDLAWEDLKATTEERTIYEPNIADMGEFLNKTVQDRTKSLYSLDAC